MKQTKSFWRDFRSYVIVTISLFFFSLGWTGFLIPNHMLGGGVNGIATIIYWLTSISTGVMIFALNGILILLSIKSLGWKFSIRTIYSIVVMSIFFSVLQNYFGDTPLIADKFLSATLGAGLSGVSIGIIFLQGSSTGGTDIIIMLINKYRNITLGRLTLLINVVVVSCSYLVFKDIETLIYSYVVLMISSYTMDLTMTGNKQSVQMFIFSSKAHVIADRIGNEMQRGATFIKGVGWYNKTESDILMVVVRKTESQQLIRIVKQEDEKAFVSVNTVMGVYGKGFDVMKK